MTDFSSTVSSEKISTCIKQVVIFVLFLFTISGYINLSAQVEIALYPNGVVLPRLDSSSHDEPETGMIIYDTLLSQLMYYDGSNWVGTGGPFEKDSITVRSRKGYDLDDFIFGRHAVPKNGETLVDTFFFFDKSKAAFRGGYIFSDIWSPDSIGNYSFAYGLNTKATGLAGIALGGHTIASNVGAVALGFSTEASGVHGSTALGYQTKAIGARGSTALGYGTTANGNSCTVLGVFNDAIVAEGAPLINSSPILIVGNGDINLGTPSNALVVRMDGNVSIGNANPTVRLQVGSNGDGTIAKANSWDLFSDERYKQNIRGLDNALATIEKLHGRAFEWKDSGMEDMGFIAQEVEAVISHLVNTDERGYKSLDYSKLIPLLVESIKELNEEIIQLKKRIP